jgi:hypothetical protein
VHRDALAKLALVAMLVIAPACGTGDPAAPEASLGGGDDAGGIAPGPTTPSIASPKANVRFLNASRMSRTYAKALGLPEKELCKELGQYQCVDFIHKISLLGTDPYLFGVNDPLPSTTTSTPLVAERVATAGCVARVKADRTPHRQANTPGGIFDGLVVDGSGKMDPNAVQVTAAIDLLYVRALQRHATAAEIDLFRQLYRDIAALPSPRPADDWAIASCLAVLTSMESLFY